MSRGFERTEAAIQQARRGTVGGNQDQEIQRTVGRVIDQYIGRRFKDLELIKERLEVLFGIRGERGKHAVRQEDLARLRGINLESSLVSSAPTQEQHNELVRDLRRIRDALDGIR